jgi:D-cysteine desulfhydrase
MIKAVSLTASVEGLLLDPVYTGKAMAGLMDLVRHGQFQDDDNVVFLHTGGSPALFAYRSAFESL